MGAVEIRNACAYCRGVLEVDEDDPSFVIQEHHERGCIASDAHQPDFERLGCIELKAWHPEDRQRLCYEALGHEALELIPMQRDNWTISIWIHPSKDPDGEARLAALEVIEYSRAAMAAVALDG